MLERIQDDVITVDIVTEAVLARPDTILTITWGDIFEFLDVVPTAAVVRIVQ